MPLTVQVVTPDREVVVAEDATFVLAHGVEGDVGILPGHAPLMIALGAGPLAVDQGERRLWMAVDGGFLQVSEDQVIVLAEYAVLPEEVDREAARAEVAEIERLIAQEPDRQEYRARLARAQAVVHAIERM
jgi:F-type H+-transporting ATPase subunit epsilon